MTHKLVNKVRMTKIIQRPMIVQRRNCLQTNTNILLVTSINTLGNIYLLLIYSGCISHEISNTSIILVGRLLLENGIHVSPLQTSCDASCLRVDRVLDKEDTCGPSESQCPMHDNQPCYIPLVNHKCITMK